MLALGARQASILLGLVLVKGCELRRYRILRHIINSERSCGQRRTDALLSNTIEAPAVLAMDVRGFSLWVVDETSYCYVWTPCLDAIRGKTRISVKIYHKEISS